MTCVAVATSPGLAASPSMRHRDDPRIFGDIRPSHQLANLDDFQGTPKLSPFLSSRIASPSHTPMLPPPSPRVQCSPRTPSSWTSPVGTPRSVCGCGGVSMYSTCSCSIVTSPSSSDVKWRPTALEKRFTLDPQAESKYGSYVEPPSPSPRLGRNSPISRFSPSMPPLLLPPEAPSSRFGGSHSIFKSPRVYPVSRVSITEEFIKVADLERDRFEDSPIGGSEPIFPISTSSVSLDVPTGDVNVAALPTGRPISPPLKRKRPPKLEIPTGVSPMASPFPHVVDLAEEAINEMTVDGPYYGISCKKGRREILEDTHKAVPDLHGDPGQAFFGVFDGHGGRKAADFAAEHLVHKITEAIESSQEGEGSIEAAVRSGYLAADAEFLEQRVSSGASCVTAIVKDGYMVVANAGDCRAVLSRAGTAEALTSDHRAGRDDERQRIESLGGFVDNLTGTWRVQGTLAVSRGLGDMHLKEWISAEPEVQKLRITPDCEFLILASDGLWDAVTNQEAVNTARAFLQSERMNSDVMDLQIPQAMASSSLSKRGDNLVIDNAHESQGMQNMDQKEMGMKTPETQEINCRFQSTTDDEEVDICMGTMDSDMPNVGFPEPPVPSAGPAAACKKLVEMSVQRGCHDDISVMIVDLRHFQRKGGLVAASS
ncbi:unnamed protein product [Calypogeia fissa]